MERFWGHVLKVHFCSPASGTPSGVPTIAGTIRLFSGKNEFWVLLKYPRPALMGLTDGVTSLIYTRQFRVFCTE